MKAPLIAGIISIFLVIEARAGNIFDPDGYVTNADYLNSFEITNGDGSVSNAVMINVAANKFFYKTPDGIERLGKWTGVSTNVQMEFGYNFTNAIAADQKEALRTVQENQAFQDRQKMLQKQNAWEAAVELAKSKGDGIIGHVKQVVPEGLLISQDFDRGGAPVLLKDYADGPALGDFISAWAYPVANFKYTSSDGSENVIHCYTTSLDKAAEFYAQQTSTP